MSWPGGTFDSIFADLTWLRRCDYTIWRYEAERPPLPSGWSGRIAPPVYEEMLKYPTSPTPLPSDLAPDHYVIDAFANVGRGGDTYQGFKLLVLAEDLATPVALPSATTTTVVRQHGRGG